MTKLRSLALSAVALVAAASLCVGLAACGGGSSASIDKTFINNEITSDTYGLGGNNYNTYEVVLYDDGTYMYTEMTITYAFSMNLGTTCVNAFGTYETGATVDGYTAYTLNEADRVIVTMDSSAGSAHIQTDTDTAVYPAQIPPETMSGDSYAESKAELISKYGAKKTIYVDSYEILFSFTNPAA